MRLLALALATLALTGCESTAERSAQLERAALKRGAGAAQKGVAIASPSRYVHVGSTSLLHSSEGTAVAVTLTNTSSQPIADVPISLTVTATGGSLFYANTGAGIGHTLVSAALIPAHGELTWVDDQVSGSGTPTAARAEAGEAPPARGPIPQIEVSGAHIVEEGASERGAHGTIVNRSHVDQRELVVYAVARRSGRIVAAGRAVVPDVPAGASAPFQLFFIGDRRARSCPSAPRRAHCAEALSDAA